MGDNEFSQEMVFRTRRRWLSTIYGLIALIFAVSFIWGGIVYLLAGHPDNIPYNPVFEWMFDNDIRLSKFRYRLICYFPSQFLWMVTILFKHINHIFIRKLNVGDEGIEYSSLDFSIKVKWEDMERIERRRFFFFPTERIVFREIANIERKYGNFPRLLASRPERIQYIPLKVFGKNAEGVVASELVNHYMKKYGKVPSERSDTT
jgi:hypothetical protein